MTSMINLLSLLKEESDLDIDVLLMDPYGPLYQECQKQANVLGTDAYLLAVTLSRKELIQKGKYNLLALRGALFAGAKLSHLSTQELGYVLSAKKYDSKYDCVISYQESIATNFVRHIKAGKRIAWVHNNYTNVLRKYKSKKAFQKIYNCYEHIICVSKAGADNFKKNSGLSPEKILFIYNTLISEKLIRKSQEPLEKVMSDSNKSRIVNALGEKCVKLVSSGRLVEQKRFDRAIEAARILKQKGYEFKWFIIGEGNLYDRINDLIIKYGLTEYVYLTGGLSNPFPVVNRCDIFVITSDFEAHPMVANEALILGKPVISTDYDSATEVITDGFNGCICHMTDEGIADCIEELLIHENRRLALKQNAEQFVYDNDRIVQKVKSIIG